MIKTYVVVRLIINDNQPDVNIEGIYTSFEDASNKVSVIENLISTGLTLSDEETNKLYGDNIRFQRVYTSAGIKYILMIQEKSMEIRLS